MSSLAMINLMEDKLVSIIVPCYNDRLYISTTLKSIENQSHRNWECIIVNDCSSDGSIAIAREFEARDSRFKIIDHRTNGGLATARNTGIRVAKGEFVCFLDADDILFQDSLLTRLNALYQFDFEEVAGSYCEQRSIMQYDASLPFSTERERMEIVDFLSHAGDCPFSVHQPLLRMEVVRRFGGFDENLTQAEDWELWLRILRHGYCFVPSGYESVGYRAKKSSMIRRNPHQHLINSRALFFSAHEPLDDAHIQEGTPFVFRKPWNYYKSNITFIERTIRFAAMGSEDEFLAACETIPADCREWVLKSYSINGLITGGVKRKIALQDAPQEKVQRFQGNDVIKKVSAYFNQIHFNNILENRKVQLPKPEIGVSLHSKISFQNSIDVVFMPHKDYHVWNLSQCIPYLENMQLNCLFVDSTTIYRDEGVRKELIANGLPFVSYNNYILGNYNPKTVICMNDWDTVVKPIISKANSNGIPTVGIVEGVQDYFDVDTGRARNPYRTVKYVFVPGEFDKKYFSDNLEFVTAVGNPRVETMLKRPIVFPEKPLIVINVNFSYNVLIDKRDEWVESVVRACELAKVDYVISQHPADLGKLSQYNVSKESIYDLLDKSTILISRFSTVILESLAMGKPAIYHNPHGERVDKFLDPMGAYFVTHNASELAEAIQQEIQRCEETRERVRPFLETHCSILSPDSFGERVSKGIVEILEREGIALSV